jgi:hypothetical protein
MAIRKVRVSRPWARQTPRVAFPVTITKPNGETFVVAPTRKQVATRKPTAKTRAKRVSKLPEQVSAQDTRAIALQERQRAFAESQRRLEREMIGEYN